MISMLVKVLLFTLTVLGSDLTSIHNASAHSVLAAISVHKQVPWLFLCFLGSQAAGACCGFLECIVMRPVNCKEKTNCTNVFMLCTAEIE